MTGRRASISRPRQEPGFADRYATPEREELNLNPPSHQGVLGFRIIGALKLATALLLGAAGFGIFRLVNKDLGEALEHFVTRLHLDPENRLVQEAVYRVSGIDQTHLKEIGAGTFFY